MNIIFRVDASIQIGTGHVMRCLTLADTLVAEHGAQCHFICRLHPGHMVAFIEAKGHHVLPLPAPDTGWQPTGKDEEPAHSAWLGASIADDAAQTLVAIQSINAITASWLIVDHYALDERWENSLRPFCQKILVIDDLADRKHNCDALLDQTFGRNARDYQPYVPSACHLLIGSQYALLRPEFTVWRQYSLNRRKHLELKHLLITMGGVDKDNATGQVLETLKHCPLPADCHITVVMGANAPWLQEVKQLATDLPWPVEVKVDVQNMAQLMADSSLCIGAAGSTSWERCCLGLPSILVILAPNQASACAALSEVGAARSIGILAEMTTRLHLELQTLISDPGNIKLCSDKSAEICDGKGSHLVGNYILSHHDMVKNLELHE